MYHFLVIWNGSLLVFIIDSPVIPEMKVVICMYLYILCTTVEEKIEIFT